MKNFVQQYTLLKLKEKWSAEKIQIFSIAKNDPINKRLFKCTFPLLINVQI